VSWVGPSSRSIHHPSEQQLAEVLTAQDVTNECQFPFVDDIYQPSLAATSSNHFFICDLLDPANAEYSSVAPKFKTFNFLDV